MSNKINLLFPIDITNRELDFRLFLACLCVREDRRIWIGSRKIIHRLVTSGRGGIYVGKNIFDGPTDKQLDRYHELKERDFRLVHIDEEGAVYPGAAEAWKVELRDRIDPTCLAKDDFVCTWGDFSATSTGHLSRGARPISARLDIRALTCTSPPTGTTLRPRRAACASAMATSF